MFDAWQGGNVPVRFLAGELAMRHGGCGRSASQRFFTVVLIFVYNLLMCRLYNLKVRGGADMKDFSIVAIIPLYNGARWIEGAIRSVFAQTLQPDEFIVVDDGSTDEGAGAAIVERLAKERPIALLRKANGGQSSARNFGVRHSTTALIGFLDQDDLWYPGHLATLVKPFRKPTAMPLGWVYSDLAEIDETGGMMRHSILRSAPNEHPKRTLVGCIESDMFILPSASLICREAFEAVGGFDEQLCGYEDDDLFLRMFRAGYGNIFLNQPLSAWRIHASSTSYTERMAVSRRMYMQKLINLFPDDRHRGFRYQKYLIVPRFLRCNIVAYVQAFRIFDTKRMNACVDDIELLLPRLHTKRRIALTISAPLMRSYFLASIVYRSRWLKIAAARLGIV
jgi:glycosyltransferase involved in cell wall biosynthesis